MHSQQRALDGLLADAVGIAQKERLLVGAQVGVAPQVGAGNLAVAQGGDADVDQIAARRRMAVDVYVGAVDRDDDVVGRERGRGEGAR